MKKVILTSTLAICSFIASAQITEGKVSYEEKTNIHKRMEGEAAKFKSMVPEFQSKQMVSKNLA